MTQIYAEIRPTSRYACQIEVAVQHGSYPFPVDIQPAMGSYCIIGGPGGSYRIDDVILFARDQTGATVKLN